MNNTARVRKTDGVSLASDVVLVGAALLSIGVSLLDFLGVLDELPWLSERVDILILLGISFLLIGLVLERKSRLDAIQNTLDDIVSSSVLGTQYLEESSTVVGELVRIVRHADETVMSLGSKSTASEYLRAIKEAIQQRDVFYYRLISGTHITHELHEHLSSVVHSANVQIAWTPKEKFGNLTVTEQQCILVFPAPYENQFSGLRLPGETNSRRYIQYFLEAFSKSLPVRTDRSLEVMCEKCSPDTARDVAKIGKVMAEEWHSLARTEGADEAGLG